MNYRNSDLPAIRRKNLMKEALNWVVLAASASVLVAIVMYGIDKSIM